MADRVAAVAVYYSFFRYVALGICPAPHDVFTKSRYRQVVPYTDVGGLTAVQAHSRMDAWGKPRVALISPLSRKGGEPLQTCLHDGGEWLQGNRTLERLDVIPGAVRHAFPVGIAR